MSWLSNVTNPMVDLLGGGALLGQSRNGGGSQMPAFQADSDKRNKDLESGYAEGRRLFNEDPQMIRMGSRLEDLSKGFNSKELGAMKAEAVAANQGRRSSYLNALKGNLAKGGVGGARGAAIQGEADRNFAKDQAQQDRQRTIDNATLIRQGTQDLNDFIMKQKYGVLGTGLGYAQLGVSERSAANAAQAAAVQPKKGFLGSLLDGIL